MQEYKNPTPEDGAPKREFSRPPRRVNKASEQKVFQSHAAAADGLQRGPKAADPVRAEISAASAEGAPANEGRRQGGR